MAAFDYPNGDLLTGLFKPADEMRRLLDAKGITPDKEIVS